MKILVFIQLRCLKSMIQHISYNMLIVFLSCIVCLYLEQRSSKIIRTYILKYTFEQKYKVFNDTKEE